MRHCRILLITLVFALPNAASRAARRTWPWMRSHIGCEWMPVLAISTSSGQEDAHFDSITLSLAAAYRFAISETSEFTYEPRFLLPVADVSGWKFDQNAALTAALNSIFSLKLAHTIRYSAEPPIGFDTTDTIMSVSLVAKVRRP